MSIRATTVTTALAIVCLVPTTTAAQSPVPPAPTAARASAGTRLGVQARLDALNVFGVGDTLTIAGSDSALDASFVPLVTPGVRLDGGLFLGLGFGFYGASSSQCESDTCDEEDNDSISGWSVSPLATFDLVRDPAGYGALYLLGWLNFANLNAITSERVRAGRTDTTEIDGQFVWGLNVGAGVRGQITDGLGIGGEFGWGFATASVDGNGTGDTGDTTIFRHGVFGTLVFEATIGI